MRALLNTIVGVLAVWVQKVSHSLGTVEMGHNSHGVGTSMKHAAREIIWCLRTGGDCLHTLKPFWGEVRRDVRRMRA